MFRLCLTLLIGLTIMQGASFMNAAEQSPSAGKQVEQTFASAKVDQGKLNYLLFLPDTYGKSDKPLPLMMFLHGAGERGEGNLPLVKVHGPPKLADQKPVFPFVLISPQCPPGKWWTDEELQTMLAELIDHTEATYKTDPQRVYLTGLSMGGFGSWSLAAKHPKRFAAVVPICGGGDPATAEQLKSIPIWVFHGAKDTAVPLVRSEEMVDALKKVGGDVEFTVYPDAGHDSWTETYNNSKLYVWMLEHTVDR